MVYVDKFNVRTSSESLVYFLVGVAHVFWGVRFADTQLTNSSTLPILLTIQFAAYLSGVLVTPLLAMVADLRSFIPISICLYAFSIFTGATCSSVLPLLGSSMLLGLIAGMQETVIAAAVLADRHRRDCIFILEMFFGLGAFLFPLLVAVTNLSDWFYLYGLSICLLAILALVLWNYSGVGNTLHLTVNEIPRFRVCFQSDRAQFSKSILLTLTIASFLYGGFETNFVNWLPLFGESNGFRPIGEIAISLFWVGIVIGRLLIHFTLVRFSTVSLLFVSGVLLTAFIFVFGLSLNTSYRFWLCILILIIGLSSSAIFPSLLSYASSKFHPGTTRVTSILVSSVTLGGSACAMPFGFVVTNYGAQVLCFTFSVLGVFTLLLTYFTSRFIHSV